MLFKALQLPSTHENKTYGGPLDQVEEATAAALALEKQIYHARAALESQK